MEVDWNEIKTEYITTSISYRKLADKYDIPRNTLQCRAKREKWYDLKKEHQARIVAKTVQKTEEKAVNYKATLYDLALKVVRQLDDMTNNYSIENLISIGVKPRDITGAIKDLGDALNVKSDSDLKEQEARIAKLRKEAENEKIENNTIQVVISGDAEEYSE